MASEAAFNLFKADLGFKAVPDEIQSLMTLRLCAAESALKRDGIKIDENDSDDLLLLVMYASYLYRKRDSGDRKPRMLSDAIHDRQIAKATGGGSV